MTMANERSFSSLGERLSDLEIAWKDRLADAEHFASLGRNCSAIAMGIYALEILLKVKICRRLDLKQLPRPFEIHDLAGLMIVSGLYRRLSERNARPVKTNWGRILELSSQLNGLRYRPNDFKSAEQVADFLAQLGDEQRGGVIPWILSQD